MENGCIAEEDMCANVEYWVLGHFKRKEGDTKQRHAHHAVVGARQLGRVQRGGRR